MRIYRIYESQGFLYLGLRAVDSKTPIRLKKKWKKEILGLYRRFHSNDLKQYPCNVDPFKLKYVDPSSVTKITGFKNPMDMCYIGKVFDGNWDLRDPFDNTPHPELYRAETFEKIPLYKAIEKRFIHDIAWTETEFIQMMVNIVNNGGSTWHGCSSVEDIHKRCEKIEMLYQEISENGYSPLREIHNKDMKNILGLYADEVLLDISRNGCMLFADGIHRLSIAKILNLDEIPVVIRIRHKKWMESKYGIVQE